MCLQKKPPGEMTYTIEVNADYFQLPDKIHLPSVLEARSHSAPPDVKVPKSNIALTNETNRTLGIINILH